MSTQDPSKYQSNQKSTSSKKIAPGDPMWVADDDHEQISFGVGYGHHDPVDLATANKQSGGYESGNAIANAGTIGFRQSEIDVKHGEIFNIDLERRDGLAGDVDLIIEVDRNPFGNGVDPNTGILGDSRTIVDNGFDVCQVDLDMLFMNSDLPGFSLDPVGNKMNVRMPSNSRDMTIVTVAPYRTKLGVLNPTRVYAPITYLINEYVCHDLTSSSTLWPPVKWIKQHSDCLPNGAHGVLTNKTENKVAMLELYSLQLPTKMLQANAGPAPIDAFTANLVSLYDVTGKTYTVAKTYTAETQAIIQPNAWLDPVRTDVTQSCTGPVNEIHKTSTFRVSGDPTGVAQSEYTIDAAGLTFSIGPYTTVADLSAEILTNGGYASYSSPTGTPLLSSDLLSSTEVLIEWTGGQDVSNPTIDDSAVTKFLTGGKDLTIDVIREGNPGSQSGAFCTCLTQLSAEAGGKYTYGTSHVVNATGEYNAYLNTTYNATLTTLEHTYETTNAPLPAGMIPTQYESLELDIGQNPNASSVLPDLDASDPTATPPYEGLSDFKYNDFKPFEHPNQPTDPQNPYGGTADVLFHGRGFDPQTGPAQLKFTMAYDDIMKVPDLHHFPNGEDNPKWLDELGPLSAASGYFWQVDQTKRSVNKGPDLINDWIVHDPNSTDVLYDIEPLATDPGSYEKNKENLKGYYMTCDDHIDKVIYLKLSNADGEEGMTGIHNDKLVVKIYKSSKYSVEKHAKYDPDIASLDQSMNTLSGSIVSYKDGDIIGKPTGPGVVAKCFAPFAPMTWDPNWVGPPGEFTSPASTGTVNVSTGAISVTGAYIVSGTGTLSSDELLFVSLYEGYKPSDAYTPAGFTPFNTPPEYHDDAAGLVVGSVAAGGVFVKQVTYSNTGSSPLVLTFNPSLDQVVPDTQVWSYDFDFVASTGTQSVGTSQWTLGKDETVVVEYTVTPNGLASGDTLTARHQIQVDYIGFSPGITVEDVDFNLSVQ